MLFCLSSPCTSIIKQWLPVAVNSCSPFVGDDVGRIGHRRFLPDSLCSDITLLILCFLTTSPSPNNSFSPAAILSLLQVSEKQHKQKLCLNPLSRFFYLHHKNSWSNSIVHQTIVSVRSCCRIGPSISCPPDNHRYQQ